MLTQQIEEWAKELKLKICSSKAIIEVLETNLHMPSENRKQKRVEAYSDQTTNVYELQMLEMWVRR